MDRQLTEKEIRVLEGGDLVSVKIGKKVQGCKIVSISRQHGCVKLRKLGKQTNDKKCPFFYRGLMDLLKYTPPATPPDKVDANLSADWLDDKGFGEAATALRRAFPIT